MERITEFLKSWDEQLFLFLNALHTPFLDVLMPWITARNTWFPLYIIIILLILRFYPKKQAIIIISYLFISVGLADFITSGIMKPFFERPRPCYNASFDGIMHLIGNCGGKYGFASSHAANSFALFGGLFYMIKRNRILVLIMLLWAILVSYSRIYVGVHYFADVLIGALIGFSISFINYSILNNLINKK
jgi:undecaprenyl-diphosphatase